MTEFEKPLHIIVLTHTCQVCGWGLHYVDDDNTEAFVLETMADHLSEVHGAVT